MNERKMIEHIEDAIEHLEEDMNYDGLYYDQISTFKERGIKTDDAGFVIKMEDGSEFQITVVKLR